MADPWSGWDCMIHPCLVIAEKLVAKRRRVISVVHLQLHGHGYELPRWTSISFRVLNMCENFITISMFLGRWCNICLIIKLAVLYLIPSSLNIFAEMPSFNRDSGTRTQGLGRWGLGLGLGLAELDSNTVVDWGSSRPLLYGFMWKNNTVFCHFRVVIVQYTLKKIFNYSIVNTPPCLD